MFRYDRKLTVTAMLAGILCVPNLIAGAEYTIKNPVASEGHDPWVIQKDGFYYYCYSYRGGIWVNKDSSIENAVQFKGKKIWMPEPNKPYSKGLWAPELHFLQGKWYVYFAADDGQNANHRMYVLQSETGDVAGEYSLVGKISAPSDRWAIDGTVMNHEGKLYFIWSGWEGDKNVQQNLYIAEMSDPTAIAGERVLISEPEYDWERIGRPLINEGPQVLMNKGNVFIIYSASGSWTDNYCLGQLRLIDKNPLEPKSWQKKKRPVFSGTGTVFSPGHASFTKSPNGGEDWIIYHAAKHRGSGWSRNVRIQRFAWDLDGNPCFGCPASEGVDIPAPAK